jgi:hypothetical protein
MSLHEMTVRRLRRCYTPEWVRTLGGIEHLCMGSSMILWKGAHGLSRNFGLLGDV